MSQRLGLGSLVLLFSFLLSVGCSTRDDERGGLPSADRDGGGVIDAGASADGGPPVSRVDAGDPLDDVLVYAHSPRELFAFDPRERRVMYIGDFVDEDGAQVDSMTDLAVTGSGQLFGVTFDRLYVIDATDGSCTDKGSLGLAGEVRFNGLTFLPVGVLDPAKEVLIASTAEGDLYRIDETTGESTRIGGFGGEWGSSGDLVSVDGAGTYATVTHPDEERDVLAKIDVSTGEVTPVGSTGTIRLFGLGYWRNQLFGFNTFGYLIEIDIETGRGEIVETNTGADSFWGAGVTTSAPIAPF